MILATILAAAPVLIGLVEKFLPPKSGEKKQETVLNALAGITTSVNGPVDQGALFVEGIKDLINGIVKIQNASGVFKKS